MCTSPFEHVLPYLYCTYINDIVAIQSVPRILFLRAWPCVDFKTWVAKSLIAGMVFLWYLLYCINYMPGCCSDFGHCMKPESYSCIHTWSIVRHPWLDMLGVVLIIMSA